MFAQKFTTKSQNPIKQTGYPTLHDFLLCATLGVWITYDPPGASRDKPNSACLKGRRFVDKRQEPARVNAHRAAGTYVGSPLGSSNAVESELTTALRHWLSMCIGAANSTAHNGCASAT